MVMLMLNQAITKAAAIAVKAGMGDTTKAKTFRMMIVGAALDTITCSADTITASEIVKVLEDALLDYRDLLNQ
jgi:hypothetical protein